MKVLHVDHSGLPGGGQLGLERYAIGSSRHRRSYLFLESGPVAERLISGGHDVRLSAVRSAGLASLIGQRRALRKEIESGSPDVVVANSFRAAVAVALAKPRLRRIYYLRQDMTPASMGRVRERIARRFVFPTFDGFVSNSEWTASTIPRGLAPGGRTRVAYPLSGVTIDGADSMPLRTGALRLLWMGRIAEWKGLHVLFDALALLAVDGLLMEAVIAGAPIHEGVEYAERMREESLRLPNPPRFVGFVEDTRELLGNSDVLIHSSLVPEPFGQVVVQGMAAGLVVVATNAGGPAEIITDGHDGILVPMGDARALAEALAGLAVDPVRAGQLRAHARETAQSRFLDESLAERYDDALDALAEMAR